MIEKPLRSCWAILAVMMVGLLLIGSLPGKAQTLPPRPTVRPIATPESGPGAEFQSRGGSLELWLQIPSAWAWDEIPWQALWTVVQWQDPTGAWHPVGGWQGTLDQIAIQEGGRVVGVKAWWVDEADLGQGPFRWIVTRGPGGALLATSEPFDLPAAVGRRLRVEAALTP